MSNTCAAAYDSLIVHPHNAAFEMDIDFFQPNVPGEVAEDVDEVDDNLDMEEGSSASYLSWMEDDFNFTESPWVPPSEYDD